MISSGKGICSTSEVPSQNILFWLHISTNILQLFLLRFQTVEQSFGFPRVLMHLKRSLRKQSKMLKGIMRCEVIFSEHMGNTRIDPRVKIWSKRINFHGIVHPVHFLHDKWHVELNILIKPETFVHLWRLIFPLICVFERFVYKFVFPPRRNILFG